MKPLPASRAPAGRIPGEATLMPSADPPSPMESVPAAIPASERPTPLVYPILLTASTAVAALFCLMYITKPVIQSSPTPSPPPVPMASKATPKKQITPSAKAANPAAAQAGLMPNGERLPGEPGARSANPKATPPAPDVPLPIPSSASPFEETNLRIQHIVTAEAPDGYLARLDLDVPVLYQSRHLRWTPDDVAAARDLVVRLIDYQEKTQRLRAEGADLLDTWNRLIDRSLPLKELRADSPSLPSNQEDAAAAPRPASLISTESIQIQPPGK